MPTYYTEIIIKNDTGHNIMDPGTFSVGIRISNFLANPFFVFCFLLFLYISRSIHIYAEKKPGMRIRIRSDPLIFGPPDPVLFSADPDPDPTCNNGFIKLFSS